MVTVQVKYSGDPNTKHLNTKHFEGWMSNGGPFKKVRFCPDFECHLKSEPFDDWIAFDHLNAEQVW